MLETIAHAKCSSASLGTADGFAVRMNGFGAAGAAPSDRRPRMAERGCPALLLAARRSGNPARISTSAAQCGIASLPVSRSEMRSKVNVESAPRYLRRQAPAIIGHQEAFSTRTGDADRWRMPRR